MMISDPLQKKLLHALLEAARESEKYIPKPTRFYGMLGDELPSAVATKLITDEKFSDGFTNLLMASQLRLSVEAVVLENEEFYALFDPSVIDAARKKLIRSHYIKQ